MLLGLIIPLQNLLSEGVRSGPFVSEERFQFASPYHHHQQINASQIPEMIGRTT